MKFMQRFPLLSCLSFLLLGTLSAVAAENGVAPISTKPSLIPQQVDPRDSLFKIFTVASRPNYQQPWAMQRPSRGTGSGALLGNGLIITNAHVIADATFIQARHNGSPQRHRVHIAAVDHDADLALLRPENPAMLNGIPALRIGELPEVNSEVKVLGFPTGGDSLSTTRGVLSRVEHRRYAHSGSWLLAAQIDAAINPGNSGGPVLHNDQVVGVVMQGATNADNIGYMIPAQVLKRFLGDVSDNGKVDGWPGMGVTLQNLESPALKKFLHMPKDQFGQRVMKIQEYSIAKGILQENDVILSIDGANLADDGSIELRSEERTNWTWAIQRHQLGSRIQIDLWRDGAAMQVEVTLSQNLHEHRIVPAKRFDVKPDFYIFGGMIFTPLSRDYLASYGSRAPRRLLNLMDSSESDDHDKEEIVVLIRTLPHRVNLGWHGAGNLVVEAVNDTPVKSLKHLVQLIEESVQEFLVFHIGNG